MKDNHFKIVIIGGGASGMMLAANLDLNGASGIILEGSSHIGSKLLMSGGGHCNITHGGSVKDFVYAYGNEGQALRRCLYKHSNLDLAKWLCDHGVPLADENGEPVELSYGSAGLENEGRVFPESMRSQDVLDALMNEASCNGWQIETSSKVIGLRSVCDGRAGSYAAQSSMEPGADGSESIGRLWEITLENEYEITAENVVAATGGITYPETGSDGSMLELLEDIGLNIREPRPALAPLCIADYPYAQLAGISVPDVTVIAFSSDAANTRKGKSARMKGDLLFTHDGLSGPVILNISKYVEPGEMIRLCYNKELSELPRRMQKALRDRARGPLGDVRTNILALLLNQDDLIVESVDERGMVTSGGLSLEDIDLKTMQVISPGISKMRCSEAADDKRGSGLYVIGEAINADGITGGYNLQLCWSTACTAADALRSMQKGVN